MKFAMYLLVAIALLSVLPLLGGCSEERTVIERSETVQESEPQMVAPGREQLE
jgi:hypothetical protein